MKCYAEYGTSKQLVCVWKLCTVHSEGLDFYFNLKLRTGMGLLPIMLEAV